MTAAWIVQGELSRMVVFMFTYLLVLFILQTL